MRILIVNADDFGLTEAVSLGILEAMDRGLAGSTSAMICTANGPHLLARHAAALGGRAGIHLQLTGGSPCAPPERIPSLLAENGAFPANRRQLRNPRAAEIEIEWHAQMERFRGAGLPPTHIDTHHHVHKNPEAFAAYCRIATAYQLPARACGQSMSRALRASGVRCTDSLVDAWTGAACTTEALLSCLEAAFENGGHTLELMCHPGYCDPALQGISKLAETRAKELATLCDAQLPVLLRSRGIALATWSTIQDGGTF